MFGFDTGDRTAEELPALANVEATGNVLLVPARHCGQQRPSRLFVEEQQCHRIGSLVPQAARATDSVPCVVTSQGLPVLSPARTRCVPSERAAPSHRRAADRWVRSPSEPCRTTAPGTNPHRLRRDTGDQRLRSDLLPTVSRRQPVFARSRSHHPLHDRERQLTEPIGLSERQGDLSCVEQIIIPAERKAHRSGRTR